ncbi:MAG TPA: hypothetical protein VH575_32000 [Gemmataceae bacterium]
MSTRLLPGQVEGLKVAAERLGVGRAELVRLACVAFLESPEAVEALGRRRRN